MNLKLIPKYSNASPYVLQFLVFSFIIFLKSTGNLCPSQPGLLVMPRTHQAHSHPRACSLSGPSIWKASSPNLCVNCSLTSITLQRELDCYSFSYYPNLFIFSSFQLTLYKSTYPPLSQDSK